ncbi:MAG: 4-(cytidine 5'-diphospho)-2-C-methyl-D-erythritol kinase [Phycisphaerales bacterium]|nr:4-(cytidine 5'-diphospho)-2-C-methyl-D-erythritol kinase [Phycisphaerales bacterium]
MPSSIHLQAPAKLNLALSVGPPGPDRMHPIASWMVTVDLHDEVELLRLEEPALSMYAVGWHEDAIRTPDIDWPMSRDLAARAHQALERHVGRPLPIRMRIEKRIPLGSGLGGGSSDAAAVLRGTNTLFDLGLDANELAEVGSSIGSDVPFLVHGGSAVVEGLGERIEPLASTPSIDAVVVLPDLHCSTAEVYGWFDDLAEDGDGAALRSEAIRTMANDPLTPDAPFNDLHQPALRAAPKLAEHLEALSALAERPAHVTGSGCGIFVLCDEAIHAEALAEAAKERLGLPAIHVRSCEVRAPLS